MTFRRFFLVRLAWALFGAWLATVAVFFIFFVVSKAPERFFAGPQASPAEVAGVASELSLSKPLYAQYYAFMRRFIENDAVSPFVIAPTGAAFESASATASVVFPGMFLSLALGVPLGFATATPSPRPAATIAGALCSSWARCSGATSGLG